MTVTGRFLADFSDFTSAVQGAVGDLGGLEDAADTTAASLSDLGDPAAVKETTAATQELTGATANAGDAFAGLGQYIAAALTIGAVTAFAASVVDLAGEIAHLSEATGLTADEVQRLMAVSNATSVPIETLAKASTNLSLAVGSRDAGLLAALRELGISFNDFSKLSQGEQFDTLATAIGGVESQTDRLRLAFETMGKAGVQSVGALKPDIKTLGDDTVKMTDDAIAGLNRLDAAWKNLKTSVKAFAGNTANELATAQPNQNTKLNAQGFPEVAAAARSVYEGLDFPAMAGSTIDAYRESLLAVMPGLKQITVAEDELNHILAEQDQQFKTQKDAQEAAAAALKKFDEAMIELNSSGGTYLETIAGIGGETQAAVRYYLEAGVAQGTLAAAYGLTATEVRAVATGLNEETKARDANNKTILDEIKAWSDNQTAIAQHDRQVLESDATTKAHFQKMADDAGAAFNFAEAHGDQYTNARIEQLRREKDAADEALRNWSTTAEQEIGSVKTAADGAAAAIDQITTRLGGANQAMETLQGGTRLQGSHQELSMGQRYLVSPDGHRVPLGEHGELPGNWFEMYTGQSGMAESAAFYNGLPLSARPNSGQAVTVNATMNYPIMNDPTALDQLARVVGDAVMGRITRDGTTV